MAEIHNLKELNELGRDLKHGDYIHFPTKDKVIKYRIMKRYLYTIYNINSYIFNYLGLNVKEKYKLAEKCYGYEPTEMQISGNWPCSKHSDFFALEGLIREIYKMLGDSSTKINPKDFILNIFEILDL